jgi:hypothetical protein
MNGIILGLSQFHALKWNKLLVLRGCSCGRKLLGEAQENFLLVVLKHSFYVNVKDKLTVLYRFIVSLYELSSFLIFVNYYIN